MEIKTKKCPYCGEEINVDAQKCRYCREWLVEMNAVVPDGKENSRTTKKEYSSPIPKDESISKSGWLKEVKEFLQKDVVESVYETVFEVAGLFLIINALIIDLGLGGQSDYAMRYSKINEYFLDSNAFNNYFYIVTIVTFALLALISKRLMVMTRPIAHTLPILSKYTFYEIAHVSYFVCASIAIINLIDLLIYQVDYEWVLLDIMIFVGLFVVTLSMLISGFKLKKMKLKNLGGLSVFLGIVFFFDTLDYLFCFIGSSIVPQYDMTVTCGIVVFEMAAVITYAKFKTKIKQELSILN